jgi:preprotein translocase subunit SecA
MKRPRDWKAAARPYLRELPRNTGCAAFAFATGRDPKNPASWGKVGRNEDCPCGSGKKYKHCHGKYV